MNRLKSSQKKLILPLLLLLLLGLGSGVIRYLHLTRGFDELDLAIEGSPYGIILTVVALLVLAAFAAAAIAIRCKKSPLLDSAAIGTAGKASLLPAAVGVIAAALAAVKALADAVGTFSTWDILNGLLLLASAILTLPVIKKLSSAPDGSPVGTASLIIVFWACFRLIEIYRDVSANPAIGAYLCDLAAMIALILMFFACSGYLYGKASPRRVYLMTGAYLFFGTLSLVGKGLVCVSAAFSPAALSMTDLFDVCVYCYGFLSAVSIALTFFAPARSTEAPVSAEAPAESEVPAPDDSEN